MRSKAITASNRSRLDGPARTEAHGPHDTWGKGGGKLAGSETASKGSFRDHALLLFVYNTNARADEAAHVQITDLDLGQTLGHNCSAVLIHGKGNKLRRCPLWPRSVDELRLLIVNRDASQQAFLNRRGQPLTRFGIHALVRGAAGPQDATVSQCSPG